jgi:hypothetical protein
MYKWNFSIVTSLKRQIFSGRTTLFFCKQALTLNPQGLRHFVLGLPDFSWYKIPKMGKIYHITIKYTKWPKNRPNSNKIEKRQ